MSLVERTPAHNRGRLDDESHEWLRCLGGAHNSAVRDDALARLHGLLLRVARAELRRRDPARIEGRERDDLAHQAAADAMMAIVGKLGQFRGDSRFTTWAFRFVILEVSAKLGRHFWRNPPVPAGDDAWEHVPERPGSGPVELAESRELAGALRRAVSAVLTDRQRRVFVAVIVDGVPLDALAGELGSTRNALYKVMFDARRKVRAQLVADGYLHEERPGTP